MAVAIVNPLIGEAVAPPASVKQGGVVATTFAGDRERLAVLGLTRLLDKASVPEQGETNTKRGVPAPVVVPPSSDETRTDPGKVMTGYEGTLKGVAKLNAAEVVVAPSKRLPFGRRVQGHRRDRGKAARLTAVLRPIPKPGFRLRVAVKTGPNGRLGHGQAVKRYGLRRDLKEPTRSTQGKQAFGKLHVDLKLGA